MCPDVELRNAGFRGRKDKSTGLIHRIQVYRDDAQTKLTLGEYQLAYRCRGEESPFEIRNPSGECCPVRLIPLEDILTTYFEAKREKGEDLSLHEDAIDIRTVLVGHTPKLQLSYNDCALCTFTAKELRAKVQAGQTCLGLAPYASVAERCVPSLIKPEPAPQAGAVEIPDEPELEDLPLEELAPSQLPAAAQPAKPPTAHAGAESADKADLEDIPFKTPPPPSRSRPPLVQWAINPSADDDLDEMRQEDTELLVALELAAAPPEPPAPTGPRIKRRYWAALVASLLAVLAVTMARRGCEQTAERVIVLDVSLVPSVGEAAPGADAAAKTASQLRWCLESLARFEAAPVYRDPMMMRTASTQLKALAAQSQSDTSALSPEQKAKIAELVERMEKLKKQMAAENPDEPMY